VRIALRTQQILAYETGVASTIDPLAGSYCVEALTDRLEREAEDVFEQIDMLGGVVPGIESGYFQREIALSAERQQRAIERGERLVVGVNAFTEGAQDSDIEVLKIGEGPERQQHARLAQVRRGRDSDRVNTCLRQLQQAARDGENVVEPMLECVRAYCTLFEIRHALEEVFGSFREPVSF
jgi:methylmalonyl-CoA mutase N-terminal domain/subunit